MRTPPCPWRERFEYYFDYEVDIQFVVRLICARFARQRIALLPSESLGKGQPSSNAGGLTVVKSDWANAPDGQGVELMVTTPKRTPFNQGRNPIG